MAQARPQTKTCRTCGKEKGLRRFWKRAVSPDGRCADCILCGRAADPRHAPRTMKCGTPSPTPHFPSGTVHPVWRCDSCGIWEPRVEDGEAPICWHCTPTIRSYVNSGVARVVDLVRMGEAVRVAPPSANGRA
jgi:hypothetical protein